MALHEFWGPRCDGSTAFPLVGERHVTLLLAMAGSLWVVRTHHGRALVGHSIGPFARQPIDHRSAVSLPISLMGIPCFIISDMLQKKYRLKWVIMAGMIITMAGTILLPFADSRERYWRFAFPGLLLGTAGVTIVFTTSK